MVGYNSSCRSPAVTQYTKVSLRSPLLNTTPQHHAVFSPPSLTMCVTHLARQLCSTPLYVVDKHRYCGARAVRRGLTRSTGIDDPSTPTPPTTMITVPIMVAQTCSAYVSLYCRYIEQLYGASRVAPGHRRRVKESGNILTARMHEATARYSTSRHHQGQLQIRCLTIKNLCQTNRKAHFLFNVRRLKLLIWTAIF